MPSAAWRRPIHRRRLPSPVPPSLPGCTAGASFEHKYTVFAVMAFLVEAVQGVVEENKRFIARSRALQICARIMMWAKTKKAPSAETEFSPGELNIDQVGPCDSHGGAGDSYSGSGSVRHVLAHGRVARAAPIGRLRLGSCRATRGGSLCGCRRW